MDNESGVLTVQVTERLSFRLAPVPHIDISRARIIASVEANKAGSEGDRWEEDGFRDAAAWVEANWEGYLAHARAIREAETAA